MPRRTLITLGLIALMITPALAGCGLRGDLKTPPPIFGEDKRTDEQKAEAQKAIEAQRKRRANQDAPDNQK